jgi:hypothetical protein
MILSRSSGETTVRDAAPATPPAMKYDDTCELNHGSGGGLGAGASEGLGVGRVRTVDGSDVIAVGKVGVVENMSWTNDLKKRRE